MSERLCLLLLCSVVACSTPDAPVGVHATPAKALSEAQLRVKLGIPPQAKTILVFAQNAHLDIDWQHTFLDYYDLFVGDIFLEAAKILAEQPRAFYSVAEMAFLAHHLAVHPKEKQALQAAVARGALRVVGGGMTSPDTLLPELELLLRDYLHGAIFAESLGARPHSAWLPDSFGHAATVPDLLAAVGLDSVGLTRVDGAPTFFEAAVHPELGLKAGSTAAKLKALGSADFIWRGPGGGSVLAHYVPTGLYCLGDDIDYDEPVQVPGGHLGAFKGDDATWTDGKIDGYVKALQEYGKTPYRFVPVGCDFQHPKPKLLAYLDGYNQRQFAKTGVWAVAAPFEDYAQLVNFHRADLPTIEGELSPYFMGFYGSRATLKQRLREAARPFFAAETFATLLADGGAAIQAKLAPEMRRLVRSNHHDFVTGTSTDAVVADEQLPLCAAAKDQAGAAWANVAQALAERLPKRPGAAMRLLAINPAAVAQTGEIGVWWGNVPGELAQGAHAMVAGQAVALRLVAGSEVAHVTLTDMPPLAWQAIDLLPGVVQAPAPAQLQLGDDGGMVVTADLATQVVLKNSHVRAEWRRAGGWALTSLQLDGVEQLAARSFLVKTYKDDGGLWRLGNEMADCALTPTATDPESAEWLQVLPADDAEVALAFHTLTTVREVRLSAGDRGLFVALSTGTLEATMRTAEFSFAAGNAPLVTGQAGGAVTRPLQHLYTPTFWPVVDWSHLGKIAILQRQSTGVRMSASGVVELMAARDARHEQCDVEGGGGSDPGEHRLEWRIARAESPVRAAQLAQAFNRPMLATRLDSLGAAKGDLPEAGSLASLEGDGVLTAFKPADRGGGVIVRVNLLPGPATLHLDKRFQGKTLTRVDATERDLEDLGKAGAAIVLAREKFGAIATLRLK